MSPRTTHVVSAAAFIADHSSIVRDPGRQIDWANVGTVAGVSGTNADGKKFIKAGTAVGDLLGAGKISPRVVTTNPAIGILETDAVEGSEAHALSGYGMIISGAVYEALLTQSTGSPRVLAAAIKTELNSDGRGFMFIKYSDQR